MRRSPPPQHRPPPPPPPPRPPNGSPATPSNGSHHMQSSPLTAAAKLIRTIDSAAADSSSLSASAAKDAEDARRVAREANEVVRRYTARSYAATGFGMANGGGKQVDAPGSPRHSPLAGTGRKRKIQAKIKAPSSSERLAQSHAEDVLSLSLELERAKQALENERMSQDETRAGLSEARAKNTLLENQIQKLLSDMETQREDHGRQVDSLQQELKRAQVRVEAAEEDAQLALELAKGNAESREQLETWLQRALQEVEVLRGQLDRSRALPQDGWYPPPPPPAQQQKIQPQPPKQRKQVVRFAESPTVVQETTDIVSTPKSQASRSMVAAGRHLLHRAVATPENQKMHSIMRTPEQSSERRQKLRDRLRSLDSDVDIQSPASLPSFDSRSQRSPAEVSRVTNVLRESGQRLGLSVSTRGALQKRTDDESVEALTKQYCSAAEAKIVKQSNDIHELQSLCDYLESKLAVADNVPTSNSFEP